MLVYIVTHLTFKTTKWSVNIYDKAFDKLNILPHYYIKSVVYDNNYHLRTIDIFSRIDRWI